MVLFRGIKGDKPTFFRAKPVTGRNPMDSNKKFQAMYDRILKMAGFKALRSNSIFTSSDYHKAAEYGEVYVIFPANGSSFSWSRYRDEIILDADNQGTWDMFASDKLVKAFNKEIAQYLKANKLNRRYGITPLQIRVYDLDDEDELKYKKSKLKEIGFPKWNFKLENFVEPNEVLKRFMVDNTNFESALQSEHEVLISGIFYAMRLSKESWNFMDKHLGLQIHY